MFVDGIFVGSGDITVPFQAIGRHIVAVVSPKYKARDIVVNLGSNNMILPIKLEKLLTQELTVLSEPKGVKLYVDSVYKGTTPLSIEVSDQPIRMVAKLAGYYDLERILNYGMDNPLELKLSLFLTDLDVLQQNLRDKFYEDLGIFVVSLAVPLFMVGWSIDVTQQANAVILNGDNASDFDF